MKFHTNAVLRGTRASQPAASSSDVGRGTIMFITDEGIHERVSDDKTTWETWSGAARQTVEAKTNGVGSPYSILDPDDIEKRFTNQGATAEVYLTLPVAAVGARYAFYCQDSDGIRIVAQSGDTI